MAGGQGEQKEQGFSFTSLDRLHRPAEFSAVMASRMRVTGDCFELRYRHSRRPATEPIKRARLGLIVPKRFAKHAVLRNLLKRLAREAFRHASPSLPPVDIVLRLAKAPSTGAGANPSALRREWRKALDSLLAGVQP
jgi:ribonuclease P protein component